MGANSALLPIQEMSYDSDGETADASMTDTPPRPSAASNGHPSKSQEQITDAAASSPQWYHSSYFSCPNTIWNIMC
jgi:hypothetical protein